MATQNLKFYRKTALPSTGEVGAVYYICASGKTYGQIYVCTAETTFEKYTSDVNFTSALKTSYDGYATSISNLNTEVGKKWESVTADKSTAGIVSYSGSVTSNSGYTEAPILDGHVYYKDTNTHNSHKVNFTNGDATSTSSTATSVAVVSSVNSSTDASTGDIDATTTRVSVPTLKVTNDLASRISSIETINTTGMQYKGVISSGAFPATAKVGDVYKITTKACGSAEVGDFVVCNTATTTSNASAWDIWQANVTKDAFWDANTPSDGKIVVADGTTGKIKTINYTASSFATSTQGKNSDDHIANTTVHVTAADKTAWNAKWDKVTATATSSAVTEGTVLGKYVSSLTGYTEAPVMAGKVYYKDTDTHHTAAFTINDGQSTAVAAQTFSQSAAKTLAIKTNASGNLTASSVSASANSGTLTISVGVASGYAIPTTAKATAWDAKQDALAFDGTYNSSSNKVATVSTVTSYKPSELTWADFGA